MRLLVNRSVFRETHYGSDVFANNRLSSVFLPMHEKNLEGRRRPLVRLNARI
jgi:hypothetical protein